MNAWISKLGVTGVLVLMLFAVGCSDSVRPEVEKAEQHPSLTLFSSLQPALDNNIRVDRVRAVVWKDTYITEVDLHIDENTAVGVVEGLVPGSYSVEAEIYDGDVLIVSQSGEVSTFSKETVAVTIEIACAENQLDVVGVWGAGGPTVPKLVSPADGAVLDNGCYEKSDPIIWDFDWSDVKGATEYHLYVKHLGSIYPAVDLSNLTVSSYHSVCSQCYIAEGNRYDWRWRVRARVNGIWGNWSKERTFDAEPPNTDCERNMKVLVDASHDGGGWWFPQSEVDGFSPDEYHQGQALAERLRSLGFTVDELARGATVTSSLLNQYDKVIRAGKFGCYLETELQAYLEYVNRDDTSLILIADYLRPDWHDELSEALGLPFEGLARGQVADFESHPITEQANPFVFNAGSVILEPENNPDIEILGRLRLGDFVDLNGNGTQDPGEPSGCAVMGILHTYPARIFFLGDINGIEIVPQPFVDNLAAWMFGSGQ